MHWEKTLSFNPSNFFIRNHLYEMKINQVVADT